MRYVDFHTHIIPKIDDGARNLDEAIHMLASAYESGAETVVLTPHYLGQESIADFCSLRNQKIADLKQAMKKDDGRFPAVISGAEVFLNSALSENDDVRMLCIEGTDTILLELPYTSWSKWHIQEVYHLIARQDLTPVIAHIERYLRGPKDIEKLDRLISVGAKFQVNASSFFTFSGRRVISTLARQGLISAIASDCHNETTRSSNISHPLRAMEKRLGTAFLSETYQKSKQLIQQL